MRTVWIFRRSRKPQSDAKWERQKAGLDPQGQAPGQPDRADHQSAADVSALRASALRGCLPDRGLVQARRRHRDGRSSSLHRLPLLHDGLSLQGQELHPRRAARPAHPRAARQGLRRELQPLRPSPRLWRGRPPPASMPVPPNRARAIVFGDLKDPASPIRQTLKEHAEPSDPRGSGPEYGRALFRCLAWAR